VSFVFDNSATLALRLGILLAALDEDFQKAAKKTGVKKFG
jgi:hypothetical protein